MYFKNPSNGYVEESSTPWLWALLFGPIYFAIKGAWAHVLISLVLVFLTYGVSIFIYPFFAKSIIRSQYLRRGWIERD
jgi:hypothetical protein